jgi:hypothetical protein
MSIPDDPFKADPPVSAPSPVAAPPIAIDSTQVAQSSSQSANVSPPNSTPGLTLPGAKTPRRVQWTSDSHIVSMAQVPTSPSGTLDETNVDQLRDALERHRSQRSGRFPRPPSTLSAASSIHEESGDDYDYRLDNQPNNPSDETLAVPEEVDPEALDDHGLRGLPQFIAPGETDGLPSMPQDESGPSDELGTASDLVRAHTGRWGVLRRRVKGANTVKNALRNRERHAEEPEKNEAFAARYPESTAMPNMPNLPPGTSVLSSLLALYGQQPGMESGATTPASSRPPSTIGSDDEDSQDGRQSREKKRTWVPAKQTSGDQNSDIPHGVMVVDEGRPEHLIEGASLGTQHRSKSSTSIADREPPSPGFMSAIKRARNQIKDSDRPKSARSGAGVFGALIQNTGHLSGAATPAASTLVPAAKRPGYTLSRYSLPDTNAPPKQDVWRPAASRPQSRAGSRPSSIHSSTAVESPNKKDGALEMKGYEKKKPKGMSLKNLGQVPGQALSQGVHGFKSAEKWILTGGRTPGGGTPPEKGGADYFSRPMTEDERRRKEWEAEKKRRKKAKEAKKKQEIFVSGLNVSPGLSSYRQIIQHVAAILARQQFLMKLARALMMFGSPSHRLETQIQATAKVLEINAQVVYLPGTMLISFGDDATHTSETKFLKQATGLDLGKLKATHDLYWNVVHDKMSVEGASKELDILMTSPVYYNWWQSLIIGGWCSACIVIIAFYG